MDPDRINELEKDVKASVKLICEFPGDTNLDEEVEITKMKILYLIYHELKRTNEKLDLISKSLFELANPKIYKNKQ